MTILDVAILGAGPYGLAAGAHLRQIKGLEVRAFGDPMAFWKNQMPAGMLLRSSWEASTIADPENALTLDVYRSASTNHLSAPVSLERFVEYGLWFQRNSVPGLDRRKITQIEAEPNSFRMILEDGEEIQSRRVVVAGGIGPFARRPPEFAALPPALASHTSEHQDLRIFRGKQVAVIGGGQSALESAALLYEAGADVEIIARTPQFHWLGWKAKLQQLGPVSKIFYSWTDVGPPGISRLVSLPILLRQLPRETQDRLRKRSIRPAGAHWLPPRLQNVRFTPGTLVTSAVETGGRLRLALNDSTERLVDHALLGTGYRVEASRYSFLSRNIVEHLQITDGFPVLGRGFESSIPGLHFLGAPAAWSYGPLMYFVSGTRFAGRTLASCLANLF
jgi:cation diffusion facilitator CzcD-associated flavoprotein CzcO